MKKTALMAALIAVSGSALAGPGYDDELLKRDSTYGEIIEFNESNAAKVDLSRGDAVIHRAEPESEKASREALQTVEEAKRLLAEAERVRKQADEEYAARMAKIEDERQLAMQEYQARIDAGSVQQKMMVAQGAEQATLIKTEAKYNYINNMLDPLKVRNDRINVDISRGTIKEIVEAIMPEGWRIKTDFSRKPELNTQLFSFTSTDARDYALQSLAGSVRDVTVTYQYFFDLADQGEPTPMIVISDRKIY